MRICPEALGLVGPGKFELDPYSKPIDPNWTLESFKESVLAAPQSLAGENLAEVFREARCLSWHGDPVSQIVQSAIRRWG